jgi:hypothetical protein
MRVMAGLAAQRTRGTVFGSRRQNTGKRQHDITCPPSMRAMAASAARRTRERFSRRGAAGQRKAAARYHLPALDARDRRLGKRVERSSPRGAAEHWEVAARYTCTPSVRAIARSAARANAWSDFRHAARQNTGKWLHDIPARSRCER